MRRFDPNPDVNELMNYNGCRPKAPVPPPPKGPAVRPDEGEPFAFPWWIPIGLVVLGIALWLLVGCAA